MLRRMRCALVEFERYAAVTTFGSCTPCLMGLHCLAPGMRILPMPPRCAGVRSTPSARPVLHCAVYRAATASRPKLKIEHWQRRPPRGGCPYAHHLPWATTC